MKKIIENRCIEHAQELVKLFPHCKLRGLALCRKLRRLEGKLHRLAEDYCNGVIDCEQWDIAAQKALEKVQELLGTESSVILINADCRGYALKIEDAFMRENPESRLTRDLGGYGIIAPDLS